jgi:hypothetical protein
MEMKDGRIKVTVKKDYFNEAEKWVIWFPASAKDQHGFIPTELVKSRMMHDYAIELGHYSNCLSKEK